MILGVDVGYSHVKVRANGHISIFPSIVGTADRNRFGVNGDDSYITLREGERSVHVGLGALEQSRFINRREDRGWIASAEYMALLHAAFSESTKAYQVEATVVTGLPIAFYGDKEEVRSRVLGDHIVQREGRGRQTFKVTECRVLPQPFGALFSLAFSDNGGILTADLLENRVGLIDIGSHTTNLLVATKGRDVGVETGSVSSGAWDVIKALRGHLEQVCKDLEITDHDLVDAVIKRSIGYQGGTVDLSSVVDEASEQLASRIISQITATWRGDGANLSTILISGGGAKLCGLQVMKHFKRHSSVIVLDDPIFANVRGFHNFGKYLERNKSS